MATDKTITPAVIIAGALIAAAIALTNHWSLIGDPSSPGNREGTMLARLDRWTGSVVICAPPGLLPGWKVPCPIEGPVPPPSPPPALPQTR